MAIYCVSYAIIDTNGSTRHASTDVEWDGPPTTADEARSLAAEMTSMQRDLGRIPETARVRITSWLKTDG